MNINRKLKRIAKIEKINKYKMDKKKFIIKHGILQFGLPLMIVTGIIVFLKHHQWEVSSFLSIEFLIMLLFYTIAGIVAGILFGNIFWSRFNMMMEFAIQLSSGEYIVKEELANMLLHFESVGGKLLLTNKRLVFIPYRLNRKGKEVDLLLENMQSADVYKKRWLRINGMFVCFDGKGYKFLLEDNTGWVELLNNMIVLG